MNREIIQAVELLQSRLQTLGTHLQVMQHEFDTEVASAIERSKQKNLRDEIRDEIRGAIAISHAKMRQYKDDLRDEIRGAIAIGNGLGIKMEVCRKLSVALDCGTDPIPFVFDAVVELEKLIESNEQAKPVKSRVQPDKPVTKWVRKNRHKYQSNAEAVRAFKELHGGNFSKLSQDLKYDLRKKPLLKTKKTS